MTKRITTEMCKNMAKAIRPARKKFLALERDCLAIDAALHAKWGWDKDPDHVKRCKACRGRKP